MLIIINTGVRFKYIIDKRVINFIKCILQYNNYKCDKENLQT